MMGDTRSKKVNPNPNVNGLMHHRGSHSFCCEGYAIFSVEQSVSLLLYLPSLADSCSWSRVKKISFPERLQDRCFLTLISYISNSGTDRTTGAVTLSQAKHYLLQQILHNTGFPTRDLLTFCIAKGISSFAKIDQSAAVTSYRHELQGQGLEDNENR